MKKKAKPEESDCAQRLLAIRDAMDILTGKWKIRLIGALRYRGAMRFMDLLRGVDGIAAKMLSKELHELELNLLVKRTVLSTKPITVQYELTQHGQTLEKVMDEIGDWGLLHRKKVTGKK